MCECVCVCTCMCVFITYRNGFYSSIRRVPGTELSLSNLEPRESILLILLVPLGICEKKPGYTYILSLKGKKRSLPDHLSLLLSF